MVTLNVLTGIATLALMSLGLGVIYGMMRIINLAHGEFLMLGAYVTVVATNAGINIWLAMLVLSPLAVGVFGVVIERCVIRFLYGRTLDSMLATWGLSLFLMGAVTTLFGNTVKGVSAPLGSVSIGRYDTSAFLLFVLFLTIIVFAVLWATLRYSRFGLIVRATMQKPDMAAALGVAPQWVYMATFAIGAALTGLAGGILAPISGVSPSMGSAFIAKSFITVIGGGASIIAGTGLASVAFGLVNQVVTFVSTPVLGEVALLVAAVVMIRILPQGITARFFKRSL